MNYVEQIFKMLNVKPYEIFSIDNKCNIYYYYLDETLVLHVIDEFNYLSRCTEYDIRDILVNNIKIIKRSDLNEQTN